MSFYNLPPIHISYRPIILAEKEAVVTLQYSGHSADSLSAYRPLSVLDVSGRVHKPDLSKKSSQSRWKLSRVAIKVQLQSKANPQKEKNSFGISTWTPTVELVDTCTRRKGCRVKADGGADTEVTFLHTQSNFCPTHTVLPGMPMHEHMRLHVYTQGA